MDKFYPRTSFWTIILTSSTNLYMFLMLAKLFGLRSHPLPKKASSQEQRKMKQRESATQPTSRGGARWTPLCPAFLRPMKVSPTFFALQKVSWISELSNLRHTDQILFIHLLNFLLRLSSSSLWKNGSSSGVSDLNFRSPFFPHCQSSSQISIYHYDFYFC